MMIILLNEFRAIVGYFIVFVGIWPKWMPLLLSSEIPKYCSKKSPTICFDALSDRWCCLPLSLDTHYIIIMITYILMITIIFSNAQKPILSIEQWAFFDAQLNRHVRIINSKFFSLSQKHEFIWNARFVYRNSAFHISFFFTWFLIRNFHLILLLFFSFFFVLFVLFDTLLIFTSTINLYSVSLFISFVNLIVV